MNEPTPSRPPKPRRAQLIPGATVFFGMVLYLNLRRDAPMEWVDYLMVAMGAIFFALALYWYLKFHKAR